MKLSMTGQMRMEQKMKLAPRMIQSMEVLQLPFLALQEKIEAELNSNPVLEVAEEQSEQTEPPQTETEDVSNEQELVINEDSNNVDDFQRLDSMGEDYTDYLNGAGPMTRQSSYQNVSSGDPDKKLEALNNTARRRRSSLLSTRSKINGG
ncbi:MAG: hypothetical protein ACYSO7_04745 [Planctomycetota bacterium]|jgi:RNA polymerase sigma-54 factor